MASSAPVSTELPVALVKPPSRSMVAASPFIMSGTCLTRGATIVTEQLSGQTAVCSSTRTWSMTVDPQSWPAGKKVFYIYEASALPRRQKFSYTRVMNRTAVITVDYLHDGLEQSTAAVKSGMFDDPTGSMRTYYLEASRGKVNLTGDVFPPIDPPEPLYGTGYSYCYPDDIRLLNKAVQTGISFLSYDKVVVLVHDDFKSACASGVSTYGILNYPTAYGIISVAISRTREKFYGPHDFTGTQHSTLAHELGHAYGNSFHANSLLCPGGLPTGTLQDCSIMSYGDLTDMMGIRTQMGRFNPFEEERAGWLPASNITTVSASGIYTVYAYNSVLTDQAQALKIILPNPLPFGPTSAGLTASQLMLSLRRWTGFDYRFPFYRNIPLSSGGPYVVTDPDGALIHVGASVGGIMLPYLLPARLIDTASYPPNMAADPYMRPGQTFLVPNNGISVEVLDVNTTVTPAEMRVRVLFGI